MQVGLRCVCSLPARLPPCWRLQATENASWRRGPSFGVSRCMHAAAVIPVCIAYTFLTSHIDWSGIRYWRRGGRIVRVRHCFQQH